MTSLLSDYGILCFSEDGQPTKSHVDSLILMNLKGAARLAEYFSWDGKRSRGLEEIFGDSI